MLASSSCLYNKDWKGGKKEKKQVGPRWKCRAVADGSTAPPCGGMATLRATKTGRLLLE